MCVNIDWGGWSAQERCRVWYTRALLGRETSTGVCAANGNIFCK